MHSLVYFPIQILIILLLAPLVNGIIKKVKAFSQKRTGAPIFQMYFDLYKLMKKDVVISQTSSWIYHVTPYLVFGATMAAALLVPVSTLMAPASFPGDAIMLIYIFALSRFFMMLSGLDTASTFGGMGSSREGMISSLMEPSMLISFFTIGLISRSTSIYNMMNASNSLELPLVQPVYLMIFLAFLIIIIAETSRIPVDDPATHLELTMVHEAMILEYSGRHLALMELSAVIKQLALITFLVNIFLPHDHLIFLSGAGAVLLSLLFYVIKVIFLAILIAFIEVNTVKLRLFSLPNLAALSFILSFLGFINYFLLGR
ncbi:respiratory chain complex I subunit 1 family protein [Dehalobacterium formicoaceticum]|uniref:NADH-quinone oxidoreductase subunit H n=1 Tax=Dehalobacterium formicoaceticum TaxID=51515 RepID=A0ABT1Y0A5_9FIRM|nr:NADH-quinone oxidoreductase subunit H [Dehalobacterium formicoaceticum]MCR6544312.1 NADH-quinone oxidoreductase subunit H [Dehalobacterium formicoaceticum]